MSTRYIFGRLVCGFVLVMIAVPGPASPRRFRSSPAICGRPSGSPPGPDVLLFVITMDVAANTLPRRGVKEPGLMSGPKDHKVRTGAVPVPFRAVRQPPIFLAFACPFGYW